MKSCTLHMLFKQNVLLCILVQLHGSKYNRSAIPKVAASQNVLIENGEYVRKVRKSVTVTILGFF